MGLLSSCFGSRKGPHSVKVAAAGPSSTQEGDLRSPRTKTLEQLRMERSSKMFEMLSQGQKEELLAVFHRFDVDGSGTIERRELQTVLEQLGMDASEEKVNHMFSTVDINNDGMVEWGEFSGVMAGQWLGRDGKIELEHAAALFREDGQQLSVSKMRELMCSIGVAPLSEAEFNQFVAFADPSGTGQLRMDTFMALPCFGPPELLEPDSPVKVESMNTPTESPRNPTANE